MWKDLNMKLKSEIMRMFIDSGISDLDDIKLLYDDSLLLIEKLKEKNIFVDGYKYYNGGNLKEETQEDYEPETFAGKMVQVFGGGDEDAASADITSAGINVASDAVPVIGNALGSAISILDTGYNIYKSIKNPSLNNWANTGLTALGIIPGFGSLRDTKIAIKAGKALAKNSIKAGRKKAVLSTITRRQHGHPKAKINELDKKGNVVKATRVKYYDSVTGKLSGIYALGTLGNLGYSFLDAGSGIFFHLNKK